MAISPYVVGVSGASGAVLANRCIEILLARDLPVALTASPVAERIWKYELGESLADARARWNNDGELVWYSSDTLWAPIASGSYPTSGMLVVPCSMASASAINHGTAQNLLTRAADVTIKEGRRLVLVPRETPLSAIHLDNLLSLARLGVRIVPPIPAFYSPIRTWQDMVDCMAGKALEALGVTDASPAHCRYQGEEG
jgi:4-hydroxy-3-polyprenylbenzoate decarboxylase